MKLEQCDKVVRVEIIDQTGRVYTTGSYKTEVQLQDLGLTLKVFINVFKKGGGIEWLHKESHVHAI